MATNISSNSASVDAIRSYRGGAVSPLHSEAGRVLQHQRVPEVEKSPEDARTGNAVEISLSRDKATAAIHQQADPSIEYRELKTNQAFTELLPEATLPSVHELRAALAANEMNGDEIETNHIGLDLSADEALRKALAAADFIRREAEVSLHAQGSHLSREILSLTDENKGAKKRASATYKAQANLLTRNSSS
jgi:hypothetical protein